MLFLGIKTEHNVGMSTLNKLSARAQQHFIESISVKESGAQILPPEVAKAILLIAEP